MKCLIMSLLFSLSLGAKTWGPFSSFGHRFMVEEVIRGRGVIWGMELASPEEMIFTEREGKLFWLHLPRKQLSPILGLGQAIRVADKGQGGLLDVKLHPLFSQTRLIFFTYSKEVSRGRYTTALVRAKLEKNLRLSGFKELFAANGPSSETRHFGSRMAIKENELFFSVGDRGQRKYAQRLDRDEGKIHRLRLDGLIPEDNPFYKIPKARKGLYSYGHRNPQGLAFHPVTGELWEHEHGPRGGDEINRIQKGANYGWPVVSDGKEYWGPIQVGEGTTKEGMESPLKSYTPSIAPSGMAFYRGELFPKWKGSLLLGSLAYTHLNHLAFSSQQHITRENRLLKSLEMRIRDVLVGPLGEVYLSTDEGSILRLIPVSASPSGPL